MARKEVTMNEIVEMIYQKPKVDYTEHQRLKAEKERREATVLEQAAELTLLKKKDRSG